MVLAMVNAKPMLHSGQMNVLKGQTEHRCRAVTSYEPPKTISIHNVNGGMPIDYGWTFNMRGESKVLKDCTTATPDITVPMSRREYWDVVADHRSIESKRLGHSRAIRDGGNRLSP